MQVRVLAIMQFGPILVGHAPAIPVHVHVDVAHQLAHIVVTTVFGSAVGNDPSHVGTLGFLRQWDAGRSEDVGDDAGAEVAHGKRRVQPGSFTGDSAVLRIQGWVLSAGFGGKSLDLKSGAWKTTTVASLNLLLSNVMVQTYGSPQLSILSPSYGKMRNHEVQYSTSGPSMMFCWRE
ncbi:hypothetical protein BC938DRAFT_472219 [Jimgerdemannia flammicorona]|uniref:Uncharacterized protein n=1 Tax=Jimgerdemannia flammicorona TaxID=994334 RepID=A0A433Q6L4_9FUNG|nr:hypothetical protein BC938DRAFT_472219 [Jimgerdemannia flammicorona]